MVLGCPALSAASTHEHESTHVLSEVHQSELKLKVMEIESTAPMAAKICYRCDMENLVMFLPADEVHSFGVLLSKTNDEPPDPGESQLQNHDRDKQLNLQINPLAVGQGKVMPINPDMILVLRRLSSWIPSDISADMTSAGDTLMSDADSTLGKRVAEQQKGQSEDKSRAVVTYEDCNAVGIQKKGRREIVGAKDPGSRVDMEAECLGEEGLRMLREMENKTEETEQGKLQQVGGQSQEKDKEENEATGQGATGQLSGADVCAR